MAYETINKRMATSVRIRCHIIINSINSNVLKMKNLLNAIQNTCIAISQKEGGKYFAFCEYSGHVHYLYVRLCFRNDSKYTAIIDLKIDLTDDAVKNLRAVLDQLTNYYNE